MELNLGIVSVICFYFISGYLMKKSYKRFEQHTKRPILKFYFDRILKLFPQYIIVVFMTAIGISLFGKSTKIPFLSQDITFSKLLLNISLLPTNYVFQPLKIDILHPHPLVPPAWSLATEFHFYLLLPFIFKLRKIYWFFVLLLSMGIQFSSFFFTGGLFHSGNFGYRFIFSVLSIFLYGYAFSEIHDRFFRFTALFIWLIYTLFIFFVSPALNIWSNRFVQEILIGGFICLFIGYYVKNSSLPHGIMKTVDNFLGNLAYPMFISHFFSFYLVETVLKIQLHEREIFYLTSIFLCLAMSYLLHLFQTPFETYRIHKRGFPSLKSMKDRIRTSGF